MAAVQQLLLGSNVVAPPTVDGVLAARNGNTIITRAFDYITLRAEVSAPLVDHIVTRANDDVYDRFSNLLVVRTGIPVEPSVTIRDVSGQPFLDTSGNTLEGVS